MPRWNARPRPLTSRAALRIVCPRLAATSPWWKEHDGVLVRVRGDAAVVREIIRGQTALSEQADRQFVFLVETET